MRIECEVCSATYTIDDAQLSDQPIGAQCPYCGHVRLVRRGDQPAQKAAAPQFGATAQDLGFGAPPPGMPPVFGGGGGSNAANDLGDGLQIVPRPQAGRSPQGPPSFQNAPFGAPTATAPSPFPDA